MILTCQCYGEIVNDQNLNRSITSGIYSSFSLLFQTFPYLNVILGSNTESYISLEAENSSFLIFPYAWSKRYPRPRSGSNDRNKAPTGEGSTRKRHRQLFGRCRAFG